VVPLASNCMRPYGQVRAAVTFGLMRRTLSCCSPVRMYYIGHGTTRVSTSDKTVFGFSTSRSSVRIGTCFGQGSTTPAIYLAICRRSIYRRLPDWQTIRYARIYVPHFKPMRTVEVVSVVYIYIYIIYTLRIS